MTDIKHPLLWFTSRSPTDVGQRHCRMDRFLSYHAGPHGTGYRRKALSVPLATGSAVHTGAELLADWIMEYQQKHHGQPPVVLPLEVIHWAAEEAAAGYERLARAKGFNEVGLEQIGGDDAVVGDAGVGDQRLSIRSGDVGRATGDLGTHQIHRGPAGGVDTPPAALVPATLPAALETLIMEQRTLIEAQLWIFATITVPQMLSTHRILGYEVEETLVLDCTCGLGEGVANWRVHFDRQCEGIVQQGRADWILEGWEASKRGQLVYDEFKTKASPNAPWEKAWEHSGQLRINMETAGRRLGKKITAANIVVLFKGWRGRDKGDPPETPKYQHSPLCYGYYDPGSEGLRPGGWAAQYKWFDDLGKGHTLPRTYQNRPVWDMSLPMLPTRQEDVGRFPSRVATWVMNYITPKQWGELVKVLGPFPYQPAAIPDTLRSVLAEERDWREVVQIIRERTLNEHEMGRTRSEIDIAADLIPRSYQCTQFSGEDCPHKKICEKAPGWEDPLSMGIYDIRTPHHLPEREACEAGGVVFPEDDSELEEIEV